MFAQQGNSRVIEVEPGFEVSTCYFYQWNRKDRRGSMKRISDRFNRRKLTSKFRIGHGESRKRTSFQYWQLLTTWFPCMFIPVADIKKCPLQSSSFGSRDTPRRCRHSLHSLHSQGTHSTHSRWTPCCKSRAVERKKLLALSKLKKGSAKKNISSKWIKIIQNHFAKINLFT